MFPAGQNSSTFDNQFADWANTDSTGNLNSQFPNASSFDTGGYDAGLDNSLGLANGDEPSTQLVRRHPNQQLVSRGNNGWQDLNNSTVQPGQGTWEAMDEGEEDLEQRALVAKKEAQTKRKQIPPFVQKLSR